MHRMMNGQEEGGELDSSSLKTRIFVGGLGASVTPNDLENTFSSLGRIHDVEIIRTNGRSFAYMDFEPASDKALSKLFSVYNGCMWKGGKLRLEKAKEHYLVRLQHEWAADAAQSATVMDDVDSDMPSEVQDRRTSMTPEKNGLKIFFPRQKKVKVLPSKGTGKHKYSFQRVESLPVSRLPLCGSVEHNMHLEGGGNNEIDLDVDNSMPDTGGISEKEINIMKTVLERLIGNEEQMQTETELSNETEVGHAYKHPKCGRGKARTDMEKFNDKDDTEGVNDSEAAVKSSDELATSKKVKEDSIEEMELESIEACECNTVPVCKDSGDEKNLSRRMTEKIRRKNIHEPPSTEAKFHVAMPGETKIKQEDQSRILCKNTSSSLMEVNGGEPGVLEPKESKRLKVEAGVCSSIKQETRANSNIDVGLEMKGSTSSEGHDNATISHVQDSRRSWMQKASWRDLVGQTGRVSFSLSSIIGGVGSSPYLVKDKEGETLGALESSPNHDSKEIDIELRDRSGKNVTQKGLKSSNDGDSHSFTRGQDVKPEVSESHNSEPIAGMKNLDEKIKGHEMPKENFAEMTVQDKNCNVQGDKDLQLSVQSTGSPAVCTFMRSENAEAEWLKTKAAVQGYAKARRKMALKSMKLGVSPAGRF